MAIRDFIDAVYGLSLEVEPWVLSKAFGLPLESASHFLETCIEGSKLQGISLTISHRPEAKKRGWVVISIKNDWKRIFAWEQ